MGERPGESAIQEFMFTKEKVSTSSMIVNVLDSRLPHPQKGRILKKDFQGVWPSDSDGVLVVHYVLLRRLWRLEVFLNCLNFNGTSMLIPVSLQLAVFSKCLDFQAAAYQINHQNLGRCIGL